MIYLIISIFYISFWLGIAILFSIFFRSTATSALAALAVWIFFSFFASSGANILTNALTPEGGAVNPDDLLFSLGQSILIGGPYIISLVSITIFCFAVSYIVFMRQEIRSI